MSQYIMRVLSDRWAKPAEFCAISVAYVVGEINARYLKGSGM